MGIWRFRAFGIGWVCEQDFHCHVYPKVVELLLIPEGVDRIDSRCLTQPLANWKYCWFCRSRWRCEYFSQGHVQLFSLVVPIPPPHFFFQTSHASRMFAFLIRQPSTARLIWFAYGAAHRNICLVPWCWVHRSVKRNPSTTGSVFSLMTFLKRLGWGAEWERCWGCWWGLWLLMCCVDTWI